jgi:methyl-accepting chemotaxis protein
MSDDLEAVRSRSSARAPRSASSTSDLSDVAGRISQTAETALKAETLISQARKSAEAGDRVVEMPSTPWPESSNPPNRSARSSP